MGARRETHAQLHARMAREFAQTSARLMALRSELVEHIVQTRELVAQSWELVARADAVISQTPTSPSPCPGGRSTLVPEPVAMDRSARFPDAPGWDVSSRTPALQERREAACDQASPARST